MTRKYQKNFGKLKSAIKNQELYGKQSKYAALTIHTLNFAFYN